MDRLKSAAAGAVDFDATQVTAGKCRFLILRQAERIKVVAPLLVRRAAKTNADLNADAWQAIGVRGAGDDS